MMKFQHSRAQFYHVSSNNVPKTPPTSKKSSVPSIQDNPNSKKSSIASTQDLPASKNTKKLTLASTQDLPLKSRRKRESMADIMLSKAIEEIKTDMKLISAAKDRYYKMTVEDLKQKLKDRKQKELSKKNSVDILKNKKNMTSTSPPAIRRPTPKESLPPLYDRVNSIDHPKVVSPEVANTSPEVANTSPEEIKGILKDLHKGNNLEDWLERQGVKKGAVDIQPIKRQLEIVINDDEDLTKIMPIQKELAPRWQRQVDQLKELNEADNLDKWLEEIDVPHNVSSPEIKAKLKKYFQHETFVALEGKSIVYNEDSIAKKIWEDFLKMHPVKQAAVVIGATVVTAVVGFLSWELVMIGFPSVLSANTFFVEVGAQIFIQRQEGAFHLLIDQAERTKPLSTAWANQYILWKYL